MLCSQTMLSGVRLVGFLPEVRLVGRSLYAEPVVCSRPESLADWKLFLAKKF